MTWFSAIIPAVNTVAANAALETAGFGPENFSVPLWRHPEPLSEATGLNASASIPGFRDAVAALPDVSIRDATSGAVEFDEHVASLGLSREPPATVAPV